MRCPSGALRGEVGMGVVLIPKASFPPGEEASALAGAILGDLNELTVDMIEGVG